MYQDNRDHVQVFLSLFDDYKHIQSTTDLVLDGNSLTVASAAAIAARYFKRVVTPPEVAKRLHDNAAFLAEVLATGHVVYGITTGYGGSADVRSSNARLMQETFVRHLNVGFADTLKPEIMRVVMAVRANSLSRGYSGVGPEVVEQLCKMLNADVIPLAPLRGSISASGDLVPLSYLAACMSGSKNASCAINNCSLTLTADQALSEAGLKPIVFGPKEALAVANAASVAASLGAVTLFDTGLALLLTQAVMAMSAEALTGRLESFDSMVHDVCLPHPGNIQVARNIRSLLAESTLVQSVKDWHLDDKLEPGSTAKDWHFGRVAHLKQDRYPLRTAAQWLGPAVETWLESVRRVTTELNSANDNPLIDHRKRDIIHCGNFQGISLTVAMDQVRQSIQLCAKLVFAELSELFNHVMGHGLPPNLSGTNICTDFGFKGVDLSTTSLMSELDHITGPLTNHVLSAEMHNQSVNSMALVSARTTETALQLLQMILTHALCALSQALDLRWLESQVKATAAQVINRYDVKLPTAAVIDSAGRTRGCRPKTTSPETSANSEENIIWKEGEGSGGLVKWYDLAYCPRRVASDLFDIRVSPTNHIDRTEFIEQLASPMEKLMDDLSSGKFIDDVAQESGKGTRQLYLFVRRTLNVPFHNGSETLDKSMEKIYETIKNRRIMDTVVNLFSNVGFDGVCNGFSSKPGIKQ